MKINMNKVNTGIGIAGGLVTLLASGFAAAANYRELKHQKNSDSEGFMKVIDIDIQDEEDSEVEE